MARATGHLLENDLYVGGNLTGSGSELTVDMSEGPALFLENETEVGPVAIDGANTGTGGYSQRRRRAFWRRPELVR